MEIMTERLLLRGFRDSDWQLAHEFLSDPEVVQYMSHCPKTEEETRAYIRALMATENQEMRRDYHFAIELTEAQRLIGWCALRVHDVTNRESNIGYALNRGFWGQGYTTEAARALLRFGFDTLHLHRICARCVPENIASVRVIENIGMQREGHKRQQRWIKGNWWDSLEHAMLDWEWNAQQNRADEKALG